MIDRIIDVLDWAEDMGRISVGDYTDFSILLKSLCNKQKQETEVNDYSKVNDDIAEKLIDAMDRSAQFTYSLKKHGINVGALRSWVRKQKELPSDEEVKEWLRKEYHKGRGDAFAEMKPEWSEDDYAMQIRVLGALGKIAMGVTPVGNMHEEIEWVKSLSERIKLQPKKQEVERGG